MSEKNAVKITELVVRRIVSSGIKFLSGPHIREIVCSILSEEHFENERKLYTRIGIPLMDYEEILKTGFKKNADDFINPEKIRHWAANRISEEYAHLRILSNEESKAHLYGDIHIHKLRYFDLRPLTQIWDPRIILENGIPPFSNSTTCCKIGPARDLRDALSHLSKWLVMAQNEFSGTQGFIFPLAFLAPYAKGLDEKELRMIIRNIINEFNQYTSLTSRKTLPISFLNSPAPPKDLLKVPFVGTNELHDGLYGDYKVESLKLFDALIHIFKKGDNFNNPYKSPKHEILVSKTLLDEFNQSFSNVWEEIYKKQTPILINSPIKSLKSISIQAPPSDTYSNFGILQEVCLNLPRLAYTTKDEDVFVEKIKSKIELCSQILLKKYTTIEKRLKSNHLPLCSGIIGEKNVFNLEDQYLSISFVGMNEALKFLTDQDFHENISVFNVGKNVLIEINEILKEISARDEVLYILSENLSTKAPYRFAELDLKHFPKLAKPQVIQDTNYYTNSAHFTKDTGINLLKKVKLQEELHALFQHGAIEYFGIDELEENDLNVEEFIKTVFTNSKLVSLKFNI
ncbi:MAG: anaerobic ribonucleoside-triphosphate reductase [Promethearchaeota archaeon]